MQVLRAAATGGRCVFDRQEQSAGDINSSLPRLGQFPRQPHRVLDCRGDMNIRFEIAAPRRGGDRFGVGPLVVCCRANDASKDGASAQMISSAFLSRDAPVTRIQSSAP